jgi:HK97 gp10 family phage protein
MEIRIEVEGVEELTARYRQAPEIIKSELTTSMTKVVIQGEGISKRLAPRWRGQLARSISHEVQPMGSGVRGEWGTALHYAKYKEFGTRRHFVSAANIGAWAAAHGFGHTGIIVSGRKQPFIKPAFQQMIGPIRAEFNAAMGRIVARLGSG